MKLLQKYAFSCLFLSSVCGAGCASILAKTGNMYDARYIYAGVEGDAMLIGYGGYALFSDDLGYGHLLLPLGLIDMPLSFVCDTLFLPYDIYMTTIGGKSRSQKTDPHPEVPP